MAEIVYRNLEWAGPPRFDADAIAAARAIQRELGIPPMDDPFAEELSRLVPPREAERLVRRDLPSWQTHYTSDDYTDMTWFAPTARFYVGRATLRAPAGFAYPAWAMNALGGIPSCIDPTINTAAKTIAGAVIELMTDADGLARARDEFAERRAATPDSGPWCDYDPPVDLPWPDYVGTGDERQWWIPETAADRALAR
jgi:aminobenzoyl-glutamate utilization protein B